MIDDSLHYSLMITNSRLVKEVLRRCAEHGLTPGQPKTLEYLRYHNGCSRMELSRGCSIDKSTATGILARMEEKGLIRSVRDASDKRKTLIYATEKGKKTYEEIEKIFNDVDKQSWGDIPEEERAAFMRTLQKIKKNASFI